MAKVMYGGKEVGNDLEKEVGRKQDWEHLIWNDAVLFLEFFLNGPTPPLTFQKWANNYGCRPILLRI